MIEVRADALPLRARLLHVGLTKTGTTAVQRAASARRTQLLDDGVRYPGTRYNHRQAAMALMRRRPEEMTRADAWSALMTEVEAEADRRIMISNEFIAEWDAPTGRRFLDELGPRTHVVITLRGVAEILPSIWQQTIKTGSTVAFEPWLRAVLCDDRSQVPPSFARHDQALVVERWVELAGADRVTVIIGSRSEPRRIEESFERLLDLRPGALDTSGQRGFATNRSLGADEAALVLRINQLAAPYEVGHDDLVRVLRNGAIGRLLDQHQPVGRIELPEWADRRAAEIGSGYAAAIAAGGARVLGDLADLADLARPAATAAASDLPRTVDVDLAAQALLGALLASRTPPKTSPRVITAPTPAEPRRRAHLQHVLRKRLHSLFRITKA